MVTYIPRSSDFTLYLLHYIRFTLYTTICWRNVIPVILVSCDPMTDLKIYLRQFELYFMVQ